MPGNDPPDDFFDDSDLTEKSSEQKPKKSKESPARDKSRHFRQWAMDQATEQVREMMASGNWEPATARHFVALYELLHAEVYGVPVEATATDRAAAALLAGKMLRAQFGADPERMAIFMSWTWTRERKQQAWREANGREGGRRLGWALQFSRGLVTDYRVDDARAKARHKQQS